MCFQPLGVQNIARVVVVESNQMGQSDPSDTITNDQHIFLKHLRISYI